MAENIEKKEGLTNDEGEYMGLGGLLLEMGRVFILAVIIIIPVRVFLFQPFFVQGSSMQPNFEDGEYLVISEFGYKETRVGWSETNLFTVTPFQEFARQDVAVFRFPQNAEEFFIKRVIGLPGETVEVRNGKVIIYNAEYPEGFVLDESAYLGKEVLTKDMPKMTITDSQYFLMGDNRMYSYDSRVFGPVNKDKIIGKVLLRAWPAGRLSLF
ncbi:MAG: signal peptidase I [Candidatus Moranbacteria bacterium]|nr:signal peptidase I [Candidatus Moranbacteria bacterium]